MRESPFFADNQSGATLVSALMAVGIISIAASALSRVMTNSMRSQRTMELRTEREQLKTYIDAHVNCEETFPIATYPTEPIVCSGPMELKDKSGNIVLPVDGKYVGNWWVRATCAVNGGGSQKPGLIVEVAKLKAGRFPDSLDPNDYHRDPTTQTPFNFSHAKAQIYNHENPLCAMRSNGNEVATDNLPKGSMVGLCVYSATPESATCDVALVSPAMADKSCPTGFNWTTISVGKDDKTATCIKT